MKNQLDKTVYKSEDKSIPASDKAFYYPINSFLDAVDNQFAELKVILLAKEDEYSTADANTTAFIDELATITNGKVSTIQYVIINTAFSEDKAIHEHLMGKIIDEIEVGTHIIADITYGPKDLPIIVFSALSFAEKFLECEIDNILYGQSSFSNGSAINTKLCDMVPLFYLSSVTNMVHADSPDKARHLLNSLLSM